ncbi:hypothetical protein [Nocardia cyriacigeorgica]|uniref:hypothetical protein n=1 Tax=Nocardia cyriacigeorgica TaxID=135487 RepID=UPI002458079B|nr:hypothetical protein [Nocardia cyriacigeorgica]
MSRIDTSMAALLRKTLIGEVKAFMPAFLSSETRERADRVAATSELLGIPSSALKRALAVHIMLSDDTRAFIAALPNGVRRPITASTRPRVAGRTITSGIDWAATTRHNATANPAGGEWVTRPSSRVFNLPENQALAWVLTTLVERAQTAAPGGIGSLAEWAQEIRAAEAKVLECKRTAWLEGVPAEWPGDGVYQRLSADRLGFYRTRVARTARQLRSLIINPSPETQVQALCSRYFEPSQDWKLFEIGILLRLCRSLDAIGHRVVRKAHFDAKLFAHYRLDCDREVRIWYQSWPAQDEYSELQDAASYYGLRATNRPDITVQISVNGITMRVIVLELKASNASEYLGSGLSQLQGYLRDRPTFTGGPASGWLVAPHEGGFTSRPPETRSLWVVSSDEVAASLAEAATAAQ